MKAVTEGFLKEELEAATAFLKVIKEELNLNRERYRRARTEREVELLEEKIAACRSNIIQLERTITEVRERLGYPSGDYFIPEDKEVEGYR